MTRWMCGCCSYPGLSVVGLHAGCLLRWPSSMVVCSTWSRSSLLMMTSQRQMFSMGEYLPWQKERHLRTTQLEYPRAPWGPG